MATSNIWHHIRRSGSLYIQSSYNLPCPGIGIECKRILTSRIRLHSNVSRRLLLYCMLSRALDTITSLSYPAIRTRGTNIFADDCSNSPVLILPYSIYQHLVHLDFDNKLRFITDIRLRLTQLDMEDLACHRSTCAVHKHILTRVGEVLARSESDEVFCWSCYSPPSAEYDVGGRSPHMCCI